MLMMRHEPGLGSAPDWLKQISHAPRQKRDPDLGNNALLVWNLCARFVVKRHFVGKLVEAVFSSYIK